MLPALFHFVSLFLLGCLKTKPSGVGPEVQEAIKQAFSNLSANLTTIIQSRLSDFKWDLVEERDSLVACVVKRVKRSELEFKSKGN